MQSLSDFVRLAHVFPTVLCMRLCWAGDKGLACQAMTQCTARRTYSKCLGAGLGYILYLLTLIKSGKVDKERKYGFEFQMLESYCEPIYIIYIQMQI